MKITVFFNRKPFLDFVVPYINTEINEWSIISIAKKMAFVVF